MEPEELTQNTSPDREPTAQEVQEFVDSVYRYAADLMFKQEKSKTYTKAELVRQGIAEENAQIVVDNLEKQMKDAKSEQANKDMLYGALWCIGGILVTAITYSAASSSGGTYVVTWGAIIFGAIQFFRGVFHKF